MFLDEARLAARIRHPNVVATLDVVATEGELFLVMEYVHGESLAQLVRAVPARAATASRPRSPSAIIVGRAPRPARRARGDATSAASRSASSTATSRRRTCSSASTAWRACSTSASPRPPAALQTTRDGQLKGKLAYMAPEQLKSGKAEPAERRLRGLGRALGGAHRQAALRRRAGRPRLQPGADGAHSSAEPITPRRPPRSTRSCMRGLARDPGAAVRDGARDGLALEAALARRRPAGRRVGRVGRRRRLRGARCPARRRPAPPCGGRARADDARAASRERADAANEALAHALRGGRGRPRRGRRGGARRRSGRAAKRAPTTPSTPRPLPARTISPRVRTLLRRPRATRPRSRRPPWKTAPDPATSAAASVSRDVPAAPRAEPAPRVVRVGKARPAHAASAAAPRGDKCHTIDAAGIWHVKPECL